MSGKTYGGRYEVRETIASGGMAEVFLAHDALLGREVAIKILHPEFARDKSFIERFRREAQAAASLNDPGIVSVFDWGSDDGTQFIVMEHVKGKTLRELIESEGPLTRERAVEIASDVCSALSQAHEKGIVHRDIKPANIAITVGGQTKVMDFGIARAASSEGQTVTQTGTIIGTANYLSPEQAQGHPVDVRSDIYSVGVVLYEMLTQEVPFKADTPVAIAYKHVKEDPVPPSRMNPEVPAELDAIVMKALAKNPANRYQSSAEMRSDLQRILRGEKVMATPLLPPDQTTMMGPVDQTTVLPVPATGEVSRRRKAIAYALIFTLFLSIIVLAVMGLFRLFASTGPQVEIPSVVNKPQEEAFRILKREGLKGEVVAREESESVPEGSVISQSPEDGRKATKGDTVELTVSKGPSRVAVPELIGKTQPEAEALLKEAGLGLGAVREEFSETTELGKIISQDPAEGEKVDRGRTVDITLSGGKESVRVPNVEGLDEARAKESLADAGLVAEIIERCQTDEKDGKVLQQEPRPRTEVAKGSTVKLTVNRAPVVPSVIGQTEASATKDLQDAGFTVEVIRVPGNSDRVKDQSPESGKSQCKGDTVTITVGP